MCLVTANLEIFKGISKSRFQTFFRYLKFFFVFFGSYMQMPLSFFNELLLWAHSSAYLFDSIQFGVCHALSSHFSHAHNLCAAATSPLPSLPPVAPLTASFAKVSKYTLDSFAVLLLDASVW